MSKRVARTAVNEKTTNTTPTTEQGRGRKGWNEEHVQRGAARVITVYSDLVSDRKQVYLLYGSLCKQYRVRHAVLIH